MSTLQPVESSTIASATEPKGDTGHSPMTARTPDSEPTPQISPAKVSRAATCPIEPTAAPPRWRGTSALLRTFREELADGGTFDRVSICVCHEDGQLRSTEFQCDLQARATWIRQHAVRSRCHQRQCDRSRITGGSRGEQRNPLGA